MENSVDQQVIEFTAAYTGVSVGEISNSTTLESLGIITKPDLYEYLTELEDYFELIFEPSDANGIVTVGDAAIMIENKLGSQSS